MTQARADAAKSTIHDTLSYHIDVSVPITSPVPHFPPKAKAIPFILLAKIKPRPRINTIKQPLPQHLLLPINRQLQQIHTRARTRQPSLIISTIPNTKPRIQIPKPQQRCPRRARDEFKYFFPISIVERFHDLPEHLHTRVFDAVVADGVEAAVLGVGAEVGDGDLGAGAADKGLELGLVEHG